jgi:hypothetical protein
MRLVTGFGFALATAILATACVAQSLGEVARQQRARKKPADTQRRVITEEELRSSTSKEAVAAAESSTNVEAKEMKESSPTPASKDDTATAAELQAKIRAQKKKVRELEARVQEIEKKLAARETLRNLQVYQHVLNAEWWNNAGACDLSNALYSNPYKEWCEEPAKLNAELEEKKPELEKERFTLEAMQEQARRQGYGSAFYDPD